MHDSQPRRSAIVLAIDGLRCAELGAYGGATRDTPALNRLACESVIGDWAFAATDDPFAVYRSAQAFPTGWGKQQLVTDDEQVVRLPAFESFDEATVVTGAGNARPAPTIDDTGLASVFAALGDCLAEADPDRPSLTWLHSRGMVGPWDAPHQLVIDGLGDDDLWPLPDASPPSSERSRNDDPDAVFEATWRYAAQVAVLDECVDGLLAALPRLFPADRQPLIVLMGLRGYPLGEHGRIGLPEAGPYAESRHVPLWVRQPGRPPGVRVEGLLASDQLPALLEPLASDEPAEAVLAGAAPEKLVLRGELRSTLRTPKWALVAGGAEGDDPPPQPELYAKPDDRWEANDVASIEPERVQALEALLASDGER
ncbi:MAG: hypothetical protein AAGJ46_09575 [Planctomycetota bacterium]